MKLQGISIKGFALRKDGKIVRSKKHLNVIQRLQQRDSKRVRVAKKGQAPA